MTLKHICISLIGCAATISANGTAFNELVTDIVRQSPALQASRARMEAELEGMKADNMLSDPEVEFERLWRSGEGENRWSAGISQGFDWPGTYTARNRAIASLREAQQAQIASEEINERLRASQLIVEIISANKEIAILQEICTSMERLQEKYMLAWEHGETTVLDVNKIKIEAIRSATALESAQNRLRTLTGELQSMTGNAQPPAIPDDLDFPLITLRGENEYLAALESAPELETLQRMTDVAHNETAIAKATRFPGLTVGYNHAYEDGAHFNGFSIGLSLPVWSRRHSTKSAQASELEARFNLIARTSELKTKVRADYANASALHARMDGFGPLVEGVNNLTLLRKALDGGELNLLSYIQEVNYFLEARLDYLALNKEYTILALQLNAILHD